MGIRRNFLTFWGLLIMFALLGGCAQDIGDIDRTQPNRVKKSDLDGVWYMLQKTTEVPATAEVGSTFTGQMSSLEKVVFSVEENYLLAYRSYPLLPGADKVGTDDYKKVYDEKYHGTPLAIFPISSHFDVKREYDATTGEQKNVIVENTTDRPWFEREYMRVEWHKNAIVNFDLITSGIHYELSYQSASEVRPEDSPYFERDDKGVLVYFDAPAHYVVSSDFYTCLGGTYGLWFGDCGAGQAKIVTAFAKDLGQSQDYEPMVYDNKDMNRFGYFRVERSTYDERTGMMESGRLKLIERHNIWKQTYQRDQSTGDFIYDSKGEKVAIPIEDREVRTRGIYVRGLPKDELIRKTTESLIKEWNEVFKDVVRVAKGLSADAAVKDVFVMCHIPVLETDDYMETDLDGKEYRVCGQPGFVPRDGDPRRNVFWIVDQRLEAGLLGYGPAAADPLTGEILSAHAHVYLGVMGPYANETVDRIKFLAGDLNISDAIDNKYARERAYEQMGSLINMRNVSDSLKRVSLGAWEAQKAPQLVRKDQHLLNLPKYDFKAKEAKFNKLFDAGLLDNTRNDDFYRMIASKLGISVSSMTPEQFKKFSPMLMLSPAMMQARDDMQMKLNKASMCFDDMLVNPKMSSLVKKYKGNNNYDQIWKEVRAEVFRSTSLHELGHTFGLRHNFSGSYDSINYFDEYWKLRKENFPTKKPENAFDTYKIWERSKNQLDEGMSDYQYTSIMDYSMGASTDMRGLGKYDKAAIIFGYTGGTTEKQNTDCKGAGEKMYDNGKCYSLRPGYVEIFNKNLSELGESGAFLDFPDMTSTSTYDDLTSIGQPYLEVRHYVSFILGLGKTVEEGISTILDRKRVRLDEYLASKVKDGKNRKVRVPYLFCTDDNASQLHSCRRFDAGADIFEQTINVMMDYRQEYPFVNFSRGKAFWWPSIRYEMRAFQTLSDLFQNWYAAPRLPKERRDSLSDEIGFKSINASMNFFAEVIGTPEYGLFCRSASGSYRALSDDDSVGPEQTSEYLKAVSCDAPGDIQYFYIPAGEGRRRFTKYDKNAGFDYSMYPAEKGHLYTTWMAMYFLMDDRANVIVNSGEISTYMISMYNFFEDEISELFSAVLSEDYRKFGPKLITKHADGTDIKHDWGNVRYNSGTLRYPKIAVLSSDGEKYDPETGQSLSSLFAGVGSYKRIGEKCEEASECSGYGSPGLTPFCTQITSGTPDVVDFSYCVPGVKEASDCPAGMEKHKAGFCIPEGIEESGGKIHALYDKYGLDKEKGACSPKNKFGTCSKFGSLCINGKCVEDKRIFNVEVDPSLNQIQDVAIYAMLFSTSAMDATLNDSLLVHKLGTGETVTAGPGYKTISFINPLGGEVYAANELDCSYKDDKGESIVACRDPFVGSFVHANVKLVKRGQALSLAYNAALAEFEDAYQASTMKDNWPEDPKVMSAYYRRARAQNELQHTINIINFVRAVYSVIGRPI